jgi:hypothetical protein
MADMREADKKLSFADYLVSRSDDSFSAAAFKHILAANHIFLHELTDLDDVQMRSPQIVKQTMKRFSEPKAEEFAKFYVELLKLAAKPTIPVADIENLIRQSRDFMRWVQEHRVNTDAKPY